LQHLRFIASRPGRMLGIDEVALPDREARNFVRAQFQLSKYDGEVTFFSPGLPDDRVYWQGVVTRLRVVESSGVLQVQRRPHLVSEPHVRDLASKLRELLNG
jgi:hypothetical protein